MNLREKNTKNVLAAVVHSLLNREAFTTLADVAEATKCEAARLRLPYDAGRVSEALALVGRTRPLLQAARPAAPPTDVPQPAPINPATAALRLQQIRQRAGISAPIRTMPKVDHLITTQRDADRMKALEMVAKEIRTSLARCAELEQQTPEQTKGSE